MASVGEIRAQLAECIRLAGEGYASLDGVKEGIGAAIECFNQAAQLAALTAEGGLHEAGPNAVRLYTEAESHARAMMQQIEEAQSSAMGGNEAAEMALGGM